MRYTLGMALLILSIMITGCGHSHHDGPIDRPESVLVLCDSLSGIGRDGWPEQLQDMAGIGRHLCCAAIRWMGYFSRMAAIGCAARIF